MAKTKISEWSATPSNNTDIDGINIAEGCAPSGINDAIREMMSQIKDWQAGTSGDYTAVTAGGTGVGTLTGIVKGNGTSAFSAATAGTDYVSPTGTETLTNKTLTSPILTTPALGTPSSATLTNATGLPIATGVSGLGTGVATALAVNVGSAGAPVVNGGALGTPSSGTVTNLTGTASININGTVGATTPTTGAFTTVAASGAVTLSGGTANGVTYLNGSKVLTSGSALTFDGTNFIVGGGGGLSRFNVSNNGSGGFEINPDGTASGPALIAYNRTGSGFLQMTRNALNHVWQNSSTETMRLTSTGLGIGTSSISQKLEVSGPRYIPASGWTSVMSVRSTDSQAANVGAGIALGGTFNGASQTDFAQIAGLKEDGTAGNYGGVLTLYTRPNGGALTERARIDASGNLGLGVTPSAWSSLIKAFETSGGSLYQYNGSTFGLVQNAYYDGSWRYKNTSGASSYFQSNSVHYWNIAPSGTAGNAISFTQAMTLDASGNLFVGQTSLPAGYVGISRAVALKQANNSGLGLMSIAYNSDRSVFIGHDGTSGFLGVTYGAAGGYSPLVFTTSDAERMRIDTSGNLLIGTTSSTFLADSGGFLVYPTTTGETNFVVKHDTGTASGATYASFTYATSSIGNITQNGTTAVAYNTSSDYRLKNITGPITTSGAYIDSLNPVEGTWKADGSTFVGLIAHEVQEASRTNVATGTKDGEQMQGMDYSNSEIIANLIAEVKALRVRVAQLEAS
jgi:hypothetical protein